MKVCVCACVCMHVCVSVSEFEYVGRCGYVWVGGWVSVSGCLCLSVCCSWLNGVGNSCVADNSDLCGDQGCISSLYYRCSFSSLLL